MKTILFSFILISSVLFLPSLVSAASPLVPCDGIDCNACHFVEMGNTILVWLIGVMFVVFAVILAAAGWGLVTSAGNQTALSDAKSKFTNAFIGLFIVLAAWLLVDTIMRGLLTTTDSAGNEIPKGTISGYGPWSQIECVAPETVGAGGFGGSVGKATIVTVEACAGTDCTAAKAACPAGSTPVTDQSNSSSYSVNCVDVSNIPGAPTGSTGSACDASSCVVVPIACKAGANCNISAGMASKLSAFHVAAGVDDARVTEGYPPTRAHQNSCHYDATCIDYSKAGGMTTGEVLSTYNAAIASGLRPVYEVNNEARRQELIEGGVPSDSVLLENKITGEHFSIYLD